MDRDSLEIVVINDDATTWKDPETDQLYFHINEEGDSNGKHVQEQIEPVESEEKEDMAGGFPSLDVPLDEAIDEAEETADEAKDTPGEAPPEMYPNRALYLATDALTKFGVMSKPVIRISSAESAVREDSARRQAFNRLIQDRLREFDEIRQALPRESANLNGDIWVVAGDKGGINKSGDAANRVCTLAYELSDISIAWVNLDAGDKWPGRGLGVRNKSESKPYWADEDHGVRGFGEPTANVDAMYRAIDERLQRAIPDWMRTEDTRREVLRNASPELMSLAEAHSYLMRGPMLTPSEVYGMMSANPWGVRCLVSSDTITGDMAKRVLMELRHHYELIVVDTGPNIRDDATVEAVKLATGLVAPLLLTTYDGAPEMVANGLQLLRGKLKELGHPTDIVDRAVITATGITSEFNPTRDQGGLTKAFSTSLEELRQRAFMDHPGQIVEIPWSSVITRNVFSNPQALETEEPDTYARYLESSLMVMNPGWKPQN